MQRKTLSKPRTTSRSSHLQKQSVVKSAAKHPLIALHQSIGNRAVQRLIQSHYIQAKLQVSTPGDQYEQEADRVADKVMRMPDDQVSPEATVSNRTQISRLQRQCTECEEKVQRQELEEEEGLVQAKPDGHGPMIQRLCTECSDKVQRGPATAEEENEEELVQGKAAEGGGNQVSQGVQSQIESFRGGGQPLPESSRSYFESRFGHDFGGVRIHAGAQAAKVARSINAQAFTVGRDVAFAAGQYSPETSGGKRLLAHELTHVVQQGEAVRTTKSPVGSGPSTTIQRTTEGHSDVIQRTIGDGHDLQSPRFAGDSVLEACFDNERLLRFGSSGPAVSKIQQALVDAGFPLPVFGVDGLFKSETEGAVRDYQREHGLSVDGIVGPITMEELDRQFAPGGRAQPVPPGPAPTPPGPAPAPPGPAPTPPGPAPTPPGPAPTPPGPAPAPPGPVPPAPTVPVTITGGSELWHFNGEFPPGYPQTQALTASAGGLPGTFTWSVVTGPNIAGFRLPPIPFPVPFAFVPAVNLVSISPSRLLDDVQVKVDFVGTGGGTGTATKNFTVRAPQSLNPTGNTHNAVPRGYSSLIGYTVQDQFRTRLPRTVEVNEKFDSTPIADFPGTNWPTFPPRQGHLAAPAAAFADNLGIADVVPPVLVPPPSSPGTPLGGVLVQHFRGHWQVGSPTIGRGRRVRTVTWRFFQDHGDHA